MPTRRQITRVRFCHALLMCSWLFFSIATARAADEGYTMHGQSGRTVSFTTTGPGDVPTPKAGYCGSGLPTARHAWIIQSRSIQASFPMLQDFT